MSGGSSDSDSGFCSPFNNTDSEYSFTDSSSNAPSPPPPNMQQNDQPRQGAIGVGWYGPLFNLMEYFAAQRHGAFNNAGMGGLGGAVAPGMGDVGAFRSMQGGIGMGGVLAAYGAAGDGLGAVGGFVGGLFPGFQPHLNYPLGAGAVIGNYGTAGAPGFMQPSLNRLHGRPFPLPMHVRDRVQLQPFHEVFPGFGVNRLENAQENRLPNIGRDYHSSSSDGESVHSDSNPHARAPLQHTCSASFHEGSESSVRQSTGESSTPEVGRVSDASAEPSSESTVPGSEPQPGSLLSFEQRQSTSSETLPETSCDVLAVTNSESHLGTDPEQQAGACSEPREGTCSELQPGPSSESQPRTSLRNSAGMRRCLICDYRTPDLNDLMVHIDVHFPVPTYICIDCLQMFRNSEELQTHHCPCRDP